MPRHLQPGDELGLPWDDWADGELHRLLKGRDFTRSSVVMREAAENAALRMGRAVRAVSERRGERVWLWVQFADAEIAEGAPCLCGSVILHRTSPGFAACPDCGRSLIIVRPKPGRAPSPDNAQGDPRPVDPEAESRRLSKLVAMRARARKQKLSARREIMRARPDVPDAQRPLAPDGTPARVLTTELESKIRRGGEKAAAAARAATGDSLANYRDVRLFLWDRQPDRERYCGVGLNGAGKAMLLVVRFPLVGGARVDDPLRPGSHRHTVRAVPAEPFGSAIRIDELLARTPDIVVPDRDGDSPGGDAV